MASVEEDLQSEAFRHGVTCGLWAQESTADNCWYIWLTARDARRFLLQADCTNYGNDAILGRFVDPKTHVCVRTAWPRGSATFEQWIKFRDGDGHRFMCSDLDRAGLTHHAEWRSRKKWERTDNQLVDYLNFISRLLRLPINGYEVAVPALHMPTRMYTEMMHVLRESSRNEREAAVIVAGTRSAADRWDATTVVPLGTSQFPVSATYGHVEIPEQTKFLLYQYLAAQELDIVGTAHTHPGKRVDLSPIDRKNNISSRNGIWSIIVPHYASSDPVQIRSLGAHIKLRAGWMSLTSTEIEKLFAVGR